MIKPALALLALVIGVSVVAAPRVDSVTITHPRSGEISGTVIITAQGADADGITALRLQINGVTFGGIVGGVLTQIWDTTGTPNGTYTLTAILSDVLGNTISSEPIAVTINNGASSGGSDPLLTGKVDSILVGVGTLSQQIVAARSDILAALAPPPVVPPPPPPPSVGCVVQSVNAGKNTITLVCDPVSVAFGPLASDQLVKVLRR